MQIVLCKWKDSTTFGHWASKDTVDESGCRVCYAAGFLVTENDKQVTIALLASEDKEDFSNWANIPIENVMELDKIKEVDWE